MSASMAEVLDLHSVPDAKHGEWVCFGCGHVYGKWAEMSLPPREATAAHQAEALAATGYGKLGFEGGIWTMTDTEFNESLAKAWDEGASAVRLACDSDRGETFTVPSPYRKDLS